MYIVCIERNILGSMFEGGSSEETTAGPTITEATHDSHAFYKNFVQTIEPAVFNLRGAPLGPQGLRLDKGSMNASRCYAGTYRLHPVPTREWDES